MKERGLHKDEVTGTVEREWGFQLVCSSFLSEGAWGAARCQCRAGTGFPPACPEGEKTVQAVPSCRLWAPRSPACEAVKPVVPSLSHDGEIQARPSSMPWGLFRQAGGLEGQSLRPLVLVESGSRWHCMLAAGSRLGTFTLERRK